MEKYSYLTVGIKIRNTKWLRCNLCIGAWYSTYAYESINDAHAASSQLIFSPWSRVCVVNHTMCVNIHRFHWRIYYMFLTVIYPKPYSRCEMLINYAPTFNMYIYIITMWTICNVYNIHYVYPLQTFCTTGCNSFPPLTFHK